MNKKDYLEELRALERKIGVQSEALDDLGILPKWADLYSVDIVNPGAFRIDIPADNRKLSEMRRIIGRSWKFHHKMKSTIDGHVWYVYRHKKTGIELEIDLNPMKDGSTCRFVKVGEKAVDVIEVRCNEA